MQQPPWGQMTAVNATQAIRIAGPARGDDSLRPTRRTRTPGTAARLPPRGRVFVGDTDDSASEPRAGAEPSLETKLREPRRPTKTDEGRRPAVCGDPPPRTEAFFATRPDDASAFACRGEE